MRRLSLGNEENKEFDQASFWKKKTETLELENEEYQTKIRQLKEEVYLIDLL